MNINSELPLQKNQMIALQNWGYYIILKTVLQF